MTAHTATFGSIGGFSSLLDDTYVFKRLKKKDYPQFVTKVIRMLGNNSGLKIRFARTATESSFEPSTKTVTIPASPPYPSDRASKTDRDAFIQELTRWRGVVNHEVGHAQFTLWKADAEATKENFEKKTYPKEHHMFNDLFENGRMERVACQHYPGMIRDLQCLEEFLGEIIREEHDRDPVSFNHIYYALRMVVNGYEPAIPMPKDLQKDWEAVRAIAEEAWETDDEAETYSVARKVEDYLRKRYEEEKAKAKEGKDEEDELKDRLEDLEALKDTLENGTPPPPKMKMPWEDEDQIKIEIDMDDDGGPQEDGDGSDIDDDEIGDGDDANSDSKNSKSRSKSKSSKKKKDSDGEPSNEDAENGEKSDEKGESKSKKGKKDKVEDNDGEESDEKNDSKDKKGKKDKAEEGESEDKPEKDKGEEKGTPHKAERGTGKGSREKSEGSKSDDEDADSEEKSEINKKEKMQKIQDEIEKIKQEIADKLKDRLEAEKDAVTLDTSDVKDVDPTKRYAEARAVDRTKYGGCDVVPLPLHDYVKNVEVKCRSHSTQTKKILNECMGAIAGMAQRFIQKVRSRVHVGVRTFKGRINRRKLHRYKYDPNIFRTQNLRKKHDASVMIIVDCSSSMSGSKINTARKAALVIGEMMYRGKVEFEIRGFTAPFCTKYSHPPFTRTADLIHYRFGGSKDWKHTQHNVVEGKLGDRGLLHNDDGESLRHFADELSQSKKDTKMMIVISDGQPNSNTQKGDVHKDLLQVIPEIRAAGIDVYAIGLSTNVEDYYGADKSVRINAKASIQALVEAISQFVNLIVVK